MKFYNSWYDQKYLKRFKLSLKLIELILNLSPIKINGHNIHFILMQKNLSFFVFTKLTSVEMHKYADATQQIKCIIPFSENIFYFTFH